MLAFIKKNIDKTSLFLIHNNNVMIDDNSSSVMPLASTVKIMIAIAYAEGVYNNRIDEGLRIPLSDLQRFYVHGTDGGAHNQWLDYLHREKLITNQTVTAREVAKGMIHYSSNANTEFLISLIGLDEIHKLLKRMDLNYHQAVFPIGSSFLLPAYLSRFEGLSKNKIIQRIEAMSQEEYIELSIKIHEICKNDQTSEFISTQKNFFSTKIQYLISSRLPGATTKEYAHIMNKINNQQYFNPEVQSIIESILGRVPDSQSNFAKIGFKGGSTMFVLTNAMYAEDLEGNKTELAVFVNDKDRVDHVWISSVMDSFLLKLFKDPDFRNTVVLELQASNE